MKLSIYGAGYVGLVTAACFAKLDHHVVCVEINQSKLTALKQGICPIYEQDLPALLQQQRDLGNLTFTDDLTQAIAHAAIHLIAVGTPELVDGSADLSQLEQAVLAIAHQSERDSLIVIKSTVPIGTGDRLQQQLTNLAKPIRIAANPEFLREGSAVHDFLHADRIVVGGDPIALSCLTELYQPLIQQGIPLVTMSRCSAELTKYAANALLATKISFMNYMSQLADRLGANIDEVRQGLALDPRIGEHFLNAGIGYGGSCFPKDIKALVHTTKTIGLDSHLLDAVTTINEQQKHWVFQRLNQHFNHQLADLRIGLWGLAFKPNTDDLRQASSLTIIDDLIQAGAILRVYDPQAMPALQNRNGYSSAIEYCQTAATVVAEPLDALIIATEWAEFKQYPLKQLQQQLQLAPVFDGRNCYDLQEIAKAGLIYYSVGRPTVCSRNP